MIKSKIFNTLANLNLFDSSQRVLVISIETAKTSDREHIKLWYKELPPLKNDQSDRKYTEEDMITFARWHCDSPDDIGKAQLKYYNESKSLDTDHI